MIKSTINKQLLLVSAIGLSAITLAARPAAAAGFTNGGFETGDFTGWTEGGGEWFGSPILPVPPSTYVGGPSNNTITNLTDLDPIVGNLITGGVAPTVYSGRHSARANNQINDNSVSTITQSVKGYSDNNIFFAWAAVLASSHGETDSDYFSLTLQDDTIGDTLVSRVYNSFNNGPIFQDNGNGWFYTDKWQVEQIDLLALGRVGNDFTLTLLGSDCPYGGHAGYVYLDGFGAITPPPDIDPEPTTTPEPTATLGLLAISGLGLGLKRKKEA